MPGLAFIAAWFSVILLVAAGLARSAAGLGFCASKLASTAFQARYFTRLILVHAQRTLLASRLGVRVLEVSGLTGGAVLAGVATSLFQVPTSRAERRARGTTVARRASFVPACWA